MNPFLHDGRGTHLRQAKSTSDNSLNDPNTDVLSIQASAYSQWVEGGDCTDLIFYAEFVAPATGNVIVQQKGRAGNDAFDTEALTTVNCFNWNSGTCLPGFFRLYNNTDQDMAVCHVQKKII